MKNYKCYYKILIIPPADILIPNLYYIRFSMNEKVRIHIILMDYDKIFE